VGITGPRWYYETGKIRSIMIYFGPALSYEKADNYTDHLGILGYNMQFRNNWGGEINLELGKSKDEGIEYSVTLQISAHGIIYHPGGQAIFTEDTQRLITSHGNTLHSIRGQE
jgi:hypothetical protein